MGRPLAFDREEALEALTLLFWQRGFSAVSITAIEEATGIKRASLYNAIGDKEEMFEAAVRRYYASLTQAVAAPLSDPALAVRESIGGMFAAMAARLRDPRLPRGCLVVNTIGEGDACGPRTSAFVKSLVAEIESALFDRLWAARQAGELRTDIDCRALARFFLGIVNAMALQSRADPDPTVLDDLIREALAHLDLYGPTRARRRS